MKKENVPLKKEDDDKDEESDEETPVSSPQITI
jgi:hypothetical protein